MYVLARSLRVLSLGLFAASALALAACGEDLPSVDCNQTIPKYSELQGTFFAKCTTCHASTKSGAARVGAPGDVNYDTYAAAKAGAEEGASQVNAKKMPYPDGSGVSDAERTQFYLWALCGTPE